MFYRKPINFTTILMDDTTIAVNYRGLELNCRAWGGVEALHQLFKIGEPE